MLVQTTPRPTCKSVMVHVKSIALSLAKKSPMKTKRLEILGKVCSSVARVIPPLVVGEQEEGGHEVPLEAGEADHVGLGPPRLAAGGERVAHKAGGAGADGAVVARLALGVLAAGVLAGRPAVVVVAGAVQRALAVVDAFA